MDNPRNPAVITATIYAVIKVALYLIGVIWPNAAPHAQFVTSTLTPIIIIFAVWHFSQPVTQAATTRSLNRMDEVKPPSTLQKVGLAILSPFLTIVGAIFGLIIVLTQQPGPGGIFGSGNAATEPEEHRTGQP